MERVVALTLLAIALAPLRAAPERPKPASKKTSAASASHKTAVGIHSAGHTSAASLHVAATSRSAHSITAARGRSARGRPIVHAAPAPSYQLHPDPDRYQTIQKALADRGYFKGDVNGAWGDDSVDAMRRFQVDQKIDDDGKIDALSLISLGLGPKHDGTTAAEPHVTPTPDTVSAPGLIQPGLIQPSNPDNAGGQPH